MAWISRSCCARRPENYLLILSMNIDISYILTCVCVPVGPSRTVNRNIQHDISILAIIGFIYRSHLFPCSLRPNVGKTRARETALGIPRETWLGPRKTQTVGRAWILRSLCQHSKTLAKKKKKQIIITRRVMTMAAMELDVIIIKYIQTAAEACGEEAKGLRFFLLTCRHLPGWPCMAGR